MAKLAKRIVLTAVLIALEVADGLALTARWASGSDWANRRWAAVYRRLDGVVNGPA